MIPTKMDDFELEFTTIETIHDDFDDIVGECGLWITQERLIQGEANVPHYDWELFSKIKIRNLKILPEDEIDVHM